MDDRLVKQLADNLGRFRERETNPNLVSACREALALPNGAEALSDTLLTLAAEGSWSVRTHSLLLLTSLGFAIPDFRSEKVRQSLMGLLAKQFPEERIRVLAENCRLGGSDHADEFGNLTALIRALAHVGSSQARAMAERTAAAFAGTPQALIMSIDLGGP